MGWTEVSPIDSRVAPYNSRCCADALLPATEGLFLRRRALPHQAPGPDDPASGAAIRYQHNDPVRLTEADRAARPGSCARNREQDSPRAAAPSERLRLGQVVVGAVQLNVAPFGGELAIVRARYLAMPSRHSSRRRRHRTALLSRFSVLPQQRVATWSSTAGHSPAKRFGGLARSITLLVVLAIRSCAGGNSPAVGARGRGAPGITRSPSGCTRTLRGWNERPPRSRGGVLERETGFEPATSSLARRRSTTELLPRRPGRGGREESRTPTPFGTGS